MLTNNIRYLYIVYLNFVTSFSCKKFSVKSLQRLTFVYEDTYAHEYVTANTYTDDKHTYIALLKILCADDLM